MPQGITGGFKAVLNGHPEFLVVHLFDRGYIQYLVRRGQSFFDYMRGVEVASQGRVRYFHPLNTNHSWYDILGNKHPCPVDPPGLPPRGGALYDVQANTSRGFCTSFRYCVEHVFRRDFR